jgi:hypothetical protein
LDDSEADSRRARKRCSPATDAARERQCGASPLRIGRSCLRLDDSKIEQRPQPLAEQR